VRRVLAANEKPLHWVGSSKRDLLEFPEPVRDDIGNALGIAQFSGVALAQRLRAAQRDYEEQYGKTKR